MKNKIIYASILFSIIISSCNSWLDITPKTEVAVEDLFKTEKGFEDALTSCYIKMNSTSLYGKDLTMTSIDYLAQYWTLYYYFKTEKAIMAFEYDNSSVESIFNGIYKSMYNLISQTNLILENIDKNGSNISSSKIRNDVKAEALAIRAMSHFDILRLYGQLPQNATIEVPLPYAEEVTKEKIPYYNYTDFCAKILKDLDDAETLFLENNDDEDFVKYRFTVNPNEDFLSYRQNRMNYYAVLTLKARYYLYIGDKDNAYATADKLIKLCDENNIELAGDNDLNKGYYCLPSECFFALSNDKTYDFSNTLFLNNLYLVSSKLRNNLFKGVDISSNNRYTKLWSARISYGRSYPILLKYTKEEDDLDPSPIYKSIIPICRLSEVYLIAMETSPSLDITNELYIKYMKSRDNLVFGFANQEAAKTEIINEYRREFISEGYMFYVYKRLGSKNMLWNYHEITETNYIIPLPSTELKK